MANAVCVYVRNEQDNILEWIVYNFVIGFDTVIVMDNLSDDNTYAVALAASKVFDVRLEGWNDTSPLAQRNCYNYVLQTYGKEFEWIAFIDSDEFVVPVHHHTIPDFLGSLPFSAGIGINWAIYGSDGHDDVPDGLVIESFLHRAEDDFPPNRHIKSIVRPALTLACANPHLFHLKGESWDSNGKYTSDYVGPSGTPVVWSETPSLIAETPNLSICRINHYFTRSRAHWSRKMHRRWRDTERTDDAFFYHDRNEIFDDCALRYVDRLRELTSFVQDGRAGSSG